MRWGDSRRRYGISNEPSPTSYGASARPVSSPTWIVGTSGRSDSAPIGAYSSTGSKPDAPGMPSVVAIAHTSFVRGPGGSASPGGAASIATVASSP
jgi:hypothetical protein